MGQSSGSSTEGYWVLISEQLLFALDRWLQTVQGAPRKDLQNCENRQRHTHTKTWLGFWSVWPVRNDGGGWIRHCLVECSLIFIMCENGEVTCRKTDEPTVTGFTPALLDSPLDSAVGLTGKVGVHFVLLSHRCHVVHTKGDLRRPDKGATMLMSE